MELLPSYYRFKRDTDAHIKLLLKQLKMYEHYVNALNRIINTAPTPKDAPRLTRELGSFLDRFDAARAELMETIDKCPRAAYQGKAYLLEDEPPAPAAVCARQETFTLLDLILYFLWLIGALTYLINFFIPDGDVFGHAGKLVLLVIVAVVAGTFTYAQAVLPAVEGTKDLLHEIREPSRVAKLDLEAKSEWQARYAATHKAITDEDKLTQLSSNDKRKSMMSPTEEAHLAEAVNVYIAALRESAKSGL